MIGMGLGAIELGPNAIIVSLYHERKGLYLNLMSVLHGLGSLVAPLFAGWLLSLSVSWRVIYRWDLLLIALFVFIFIFLRFPKAEEKAQLDFRHIPQIAFKGQLPWFYVAIAFYVAAEIGMASWLVTFLQEIRSASVTASTQALSLFFAMLMIGRLVGGFFVQRIGYLRSILFMTIGGIVLHCRRLVRTKRDLLPFTDHRLLPFDHLPHHHSRSFRYAHRKRKHHSRRTLYLCRAWRRHWSLVHRMGQRPVRSANRILAQYCVYDDITHLGRNSYEKDFKWTKNLTGDFSRLRKLTAP